MLELNPEIICFIIAKAHEFHTRESIVIPEEPTNPPEDWALQVLAEHGEDLTYQEIKATIEDLEPDQQETLVALMWLGRGDYEAEEWGAAQQAAHESHNERTAEYLIATPLVADYLEEGLSLLGYSCDE